MIDEEIVPKMDSEHTQKEPSKVFFTLSVSIEHLVHKGRIKISSFSETLFR